ncbi:flagellar attachment zone protein 1-like [Maniola hyperantus]|uniref:flagellar attachment zone protein 1-like n=1 Tax=Aphantopus hyperantus TaxID=2795564 RepID=UPI0037491223
MSKGHVKSKLRIPKVVDEPSMSDTTLLVTIEDLINRAMGPPEANVVDFKLVRLILEILARQQRILQQKIEIRITALQQEKTKIKTAVDVSSEKSLSKSPPQAESFDVVRHKRKSSQKQKKRDVEIKEKERFEKAETMEKLEKEELKEIQEQEMAEEKEQIEKRVQDEFQKMTQVELKILLDREQEEIDEYEMAEKISQGEVTSENESRKEGLEKEVGEKVENVKHKLSQTEREIVEKEQVVKKRHHEKIEEISQKETKEIHRQDEDERVSLKESEILNIEKITEIEELRKTEKIPEKEEEQMNLIKQFDTEEKRDQKYQRKELNIPKNKLIMKKFSAIDFVAKSQFALLEVAVEELKSMAPPKPIQSLGNEKLISDMMKGTVSLPEAMETLQVEKKMKSAEQSVTRIVEILTQLVAGGALPEDIAEQVETIIPPSFDEAIQSQPLVEKKSVALDAKATQSQATQSLTRGLDSHPSITAEPSVATSMVSRTPTVSKFSSILKVPCVTHTDMRMYLKDLKDDITKIFDRMIDKVTEATATATHINKVVADKLDVAQKLDSRISALHVLLKDFANQFSGFDSVLTIRLQNIKDQIAQSHQILNSGIAQLADANNNAEVTAIMNLLEHSEEIEAELSNMPDEIKGLMVSQIEQRSQMRAVIRDMKNRKEKMAHLAELLTARDSVQHQLQVLNNKIKIVTAVLGDPEIALTTRKLAVDATCGSCHEPAQMDPVDATSGVPPRLPPLRQAPVAPSKEPCFSELVRAWSPETRHVSCRRWCGGSHTVVADPTKRFELHVQMQAIPTKQFFDYGDDGRAINSVHDSISELLTKRRGLDVTG